MRSCTGAQTALARRREDRHRRDPLAADAALVPEPGEGERRAVVDRVAERHALAASALGPQPLVPAVGDTRQRRSARSISGAKWRLSSSVSSAR